MTGIKYILGLVVWIISMNKLGLILGTVSVAALLITIIIFVFLRSRNLEVKRMGDRFEDIHIVEMPDGKWINLKFKDHIYYLAKPRQINKEAKRLKSLLEISGNKRQVEIFVYRFQTGEFCNENVEDYVNRIEEKIGNRRIAKHATMKDKEGYYQKIHHGESEERDANIREYEWEPKQDI